MGEWVSVCVCVLTSWFECDIINVDIYSSAHQDCVVTRCQKKRRVTREEDINVCSYAVRHRRHTQASGLSLTVFFGVGRRSEDVQVIVQTPLIET